ncbi:hypothetical protein AB0C00_20655, partial [Micromonospora carbonacea]
MSGDFIDRWRDPAEPSWVFEPTTEWQPQFPGQRYPGDIGLRHQPPRGRAAAVGRAEVQPVSPAPDGHDPYRRPGSDEHDRYRRPTTDHDPYRRPGTEQDPYRRPGTEQDAHPRPSEQDAFRRPVTEPDGYRRPGTEHDPYRRPADDGRRAAPDERDRYRRPAPEEHDPYRPRPAADDHAPYRRPAPGDAAPHRRHAPDDAAPHRRPGSDDAVPHRRHAATDEQPAHSRRAADEHAPYRRPPAPDEWGPARRGWEERGPAEAYPPRHPAHDQPDQPGRHDRRSPGRTPDHDAAVGRYDPPRYDQPRPADPGRRPGPAEATPVSPAARSDAGWLPEPDEHPNRPYGDRPGPAAAGWPERRRSTLDRDGRVGPGPDGWPGPQAAGTGQGADRLDRQQGRPADAPRHPADLPARPAADAPRHPGDLPARPTADAPRRPGDRGGPAQYRDARPYRDGRDAAAHAEEHREPGVRPAPPRDGALPWPQPGQLRPDLGRNPAPANPHRGDPRRGE